MASNQTANFGLNQWEATDKVLRQEFNADNAKIDAALAALAGGAKIAAGSYIGTGSCGSASPNTLTFDFEPKVLFISSVYAYQQHARLVAVRGEVNKCCVTRYSQSHGYIIPGQVTVNWNGNTVSWWDSEVIAQCNHSGERYVYFAIG